MRSIVAAMIVIGLAAGQLYADDTNQPPPTPDQEQPEVLTSGPVHEAFAEPVNLQVQAGLVVPDEPPATIQEVPPAERPQGAQFVWVPGYWAWDTGRHGYIWVSACWRAAPPKTYWVPGYWARVPEGWEWIAGFWAPAGVQKIEYLPAPPAIDNMEPLVLPPSPDDVWAPPCQYWYQGHYVLRPGYWVHGQAGWVWVPSHYTWTPRGYVFVAGHWDYSLARRGVLFAPVYLPRHVRERPGFSYQLSVAVDIGALRVNLFTYPRYSHYCFGDYYDDAYLRIGIYPRFETERIHTWYDPIYQYDRWHNHNTQPNWEEHERHEYDLRRADRDLRPPRTYHEMEVRQAKLPEPRRRDLQMARPLNAVVASKETSFKFEPVNRSERNRITRQATNVHKFGEQRDRWESPVASRKPLQPLPESKGAVTPPPEHKDRASAPIERRGPATGPTAPTPREEKSPAATRIEQARAERTSPFVSPRKLEVTKPETVRIPKPPIVGKSVSEGKREVNLPPKPSDERQTTRGDKIRGADKRNTKNDDKSR